MAYKICVVGAGYWGKNHIRTLYEMNSLSGIVDSKKDVLFPMKNEYPDILFHSSIDEALKQDYDGFVIATPADTHFKVAKKIIKSQKHVLIEKPMTLNISDAERLIELSKKNNVNIMVGHVLLFHPAIAKIKEIITSGQIGKLQYIYSNRLNLGKVRSEENVFWSLAPHDIAIFQYLTNSFPKKIKSTGSSFIQKGIPDSTLTHIEYDNGIEGHIFVSWLHPFKEHRLVVIGSEAMISFEDSMEGKPLKLFSKKYDIVGGVPEKFDGPVEVITYKKEMPLKCEIEYFLEHLDGKKLKFSNAQDGLEVVRILKNASDQLIK